MAIFVAFGMHGILAQTVTATLSGTITDSSGAVVTGATVTIVETATGVKRASITNNEGLYTVTQLAPGTYNVSATRAGFATSTRTGIALQINQMANVSFALAPGSAETTVEVSSEAPLLGTGNVSLGTVIDQKEVNDLPLNGRQFSQLIQLVPGVIPVSVGQSLSPGIGSGSISPGIDGQSNRANLTFIDGVLATDSLFTSFSVSPSIDAIQSFQVQSHAADAQFGQSTGGTINVATKSGTNQYHGTAYEFFRNQSLNAKNYFDTTLQPFRLNDFGGTIGGPALKNRLFLFGYYEGVRQTAPSSSFTIVPTDQELGGDFSDIASPIFDPTTYNAATNTTQQFAGNKIPSNRLNQGILAAIKAFVPAANYKDPNGIFNYQNSTAKTLTQNQYGIRGDYNMTSRDLFYARVLVNNEVSISPQQLAGNDFLSTYNDKNVSLNYVHMFTPTLTMQITGGLNYFDYPLYTIQKNGSAVFDAAGFAAGFTATPGGIGLPYIPAIIAAGEFSIGAGWGGKGQNQQTLEQIGGTVSKQVGAHALRFGSAIYWTNEAGNYAADLEIFSQQATWNPCFVKNATTGACQAGNSGYSIASVLLGLPVSASRQLGDSLQVINDRILGIFAQDSWKVAPKLTVNYGLRWDYNTLPTETKNRFSYFDYRTNTWFISPGNPATPAGPLPNGVAIASTNTINSPDYKNFSPRLGLSYLLFPKTVIRLGAGSFYDNWAGILQAAQSSRGQWPNGANQSVSNLNISQVTPNASAQNPFGTLQPIAQPTPFPSAGDFWDTKFKNANSWQYNLEIQRQLSNASILSVAYVGGSTARAPVTIPRNVAHTLGPTLVKPFPQMAQFTVTESSGHIKYNAFQSKYERRFDHGFAAIASFTYSHSIDVGCSDIFVSCQIQNPYNLKQEESRSAIDVPLVLNLSAVYELPFGKGKQLLNSGPAALILGNFQINAIFLTRSGIPVNPTINFDNANANGGTQRPNIVGDPYAGAKTRQHYFNSAAFVQPAQYTYGDAGRNSLRGPRFTNVDFSLFRNFGLPKEENIQFRADTFNLLNHPNFGNPDGVIEDAGFGRLSSTVGNPREIQLAVKYIF